MPGYLLSQPVKWTQQQQQTLIVWSDADKSNIIYKVLLSWQEVHALTFWVSPNITVISRAHKLIRLSGTPVQLLLMQISNHPVTWQ